jgi:hypothetical protein
MLLILATWKTKIGRIVVKASTTALEESGSRPTHASSSQDPISKIT